MITRLISAMTLLALPVGAVAGTIFEATPTDPGGAFDITAAPGSSLPADSSIYVGSIFGGAGFAVSGVENFSITRNGGGYMKKLTFEAYEPTSPQLLEGCNTTCEQSTFTFDLFKDGIVQANYVASLPDDSIATIIVGTGSFEFDTVVVTEVVGGADNEFFANFSAEVDMPAVPLPAAGLMLLGGLGGLAGLRRRG